MYVSIQNASAVGSDPVSFSLEALKLEEATGNVKVSCIHTPIYILYVLDTLIDMIYNNVHDDAVVYARIIILCLSKYVYNRFESVNNIFRPLINSRSCSPDSSGTEQQRR